jgi:type IV pilus assembly protein PilZ
MSDAAGGFLNYKFVDSTGLYSSYMPFLVGGGVFIPTNRRFNVGDEVFLALSFLEDPQKFGVTGKVVWITPRGAQTGKPQGVGFQFVEDGQGVKNHIEQLLTGSLQSARPTSTL